MRAVFHIEAETEVEFWNAANAIIAACYAQNVRHTVTPLDEHAAKCLVGVPGALPLPVPYCSYCEWSGGIGAFIDCEQPGKWHGTSLGPMLCKRHTPREFWP
jgi:hypothetical protein